MVMEEIKVVAAAEVAGMLGVGVARVHALAKEPGFPTPIATLRVGKIWLADHIEDWMRRTGRTKEREDQS